MTQLAFRDERMWLDDGLRWYQREIALAVFKALEEHRSTLAVAATGLGKTQIFSAVAGDWDGKVLVLAHRDELVDQARKRMEAMTGEWVQVEKGLQRAELTTRLVVASVDTMRSPKRLQRFPNDHFSLIIVDEAHHYVGNTYVRPLEYFSKAKVLGVTATPDRGDKRALGQVFDSVAYVMGIEEGIDEGYLVPILGQQVTLDTIDISGISKNGGDLAVGQLDEAMLKAVEGVVRETLRLQPDRQAICFFPGVKSAEYAALKFNALKPGSAQFLSGETPIDERRQLVAQYKRGDFAYLCNCMVATEGFDAPAASLIVLARPTLSRALYAQMIGRGTRTLPGVVDVYPGKAQGAERRAAIARSGKPDVVVLDFVGNCGKHTLVTLEDVLGGRYTDAEVKLAKKKRESCGGDARAALEAARAELLKLAAAVQAKVKSEVQRFDPFRALNIERTGIVDNSRGRKRATAAQVSFLEHAGIEREALTSISHEDAGKLVATVRKRRQQGLCTFRQLRTLSKYGLSDPNLTFYRANAAITYIQSKGWGRNGSIDPNVLHRIATFTREPGEEG